MPMPLEGIRVLDWTIWQQGPVCSAILGDLGADVIKIEERIGGDPGRGMLRLAGLETSDRPNFYFTANNRNKRGITLDLKKPEAREIIYRLAKTSDVFVQNFRKGVADRLGIGYADLKTHNPRIIYASANGYGPRGAECASPSFDYLGPSALRDHARRGRARHAALRDRRRHRRPDGRDPVGLRRGHGASCP